MAQLNLCMANGSTDIKNYERCKSAHGHRCASCSEAIELDALIIQARRNLDGLLFRKRDLHIGINSNHDYVTGRVPPEVSTMIFLFALSEDGPRSFLDSVKTETYPRSTITTPLALGAVCRDWRRIIWASPRLWTNISIPLKPSPDFGFLKIAADWLDRSGQHPISLRIYAPQATFGEAFSTEALRDRVKDFISPYLPRCHRFEISCPVQLLPSFTGQTPILEEISITSDGPQTAGTRSINLDMTHSKIKDIRLSLTGYNIQSLTFPFQLVSNFRGTVTLDQCMQTLRVCTSLQECQILGLKESPPIYPVVPVTHHGIKRLSLHSQAHPSSAVLSAVTLPNLTHLTGSDLIPSSIRSFVARSLCKLQCLSLESLCCEGTELCEMLRSIESLQELHLQEDDFSQYDLDVFFKELGQTAVIKPDQSTVPLLPNLSVLTIKFREEAGFPWVLAARSFGSVSDLHNSWRRPINDFQIIYDWRIGISRKVRERSNFWWEFGNPMPDPTLFLSWEVTQRFLDIAEVVDINLYDAYAKEDMLRLSLEHYCIPVPEWYGTKEYPELSELEKLEIVSDFSDDEESNSDESDDESDAEGSGAESESGVSDAHTDVLDETYDDDLGLPPGVVGTTMDLVPSPIL